jgi:hypothetical protein
MLVLDIISYYNLILSAAFHINIFFFKYSHSFHTGDKKNSKPHFVYLNNTQAFRTVWHRKYLLSELRSQNKIMLHLEVIYMYFWKHIKHE